MADRSDDPTEGWTPYGDIRDYGSDGASRHDAEADGPTHYEGQYVAGGAAWGDHDPSAAGAGLDGDWQAAHEEAQPDDLAPAHVDAAPASAAPARERTGRGPLVLGIAIGAVAIGGAFIAGALLMPGPTGGGSPADAVDLSGDWTGHVDTVIGSRVEFVVTIDDDGSTLNGTVEYSSFACTSTVAQTARDATTVTVAETITSGSCVSTDSLVTYRLDPADPDRLILDTSTGEGEMSRG